MTEEELWYGLKKNGGLSFGGTGGEGQAAAGQALIAAACANNVEEVRRLSEDRDKSFLDYRDAQGYTAIIYASQEGHFEVVRYLLQQGANVNAANCNGVSALAYATSRGHVMVANLLMQHGANLLMQQATVYDVGKQSNNIKRNDEDVAVHLNGALFYCGRKLGEQAIPGSSDGRCGPSTGPQCASCKRFQLSMVIEQFSPGVHMVIYLIFSVQCVHACNKVVRKKKYWSSI
jgi:hypothetical protein